jgi:hypothetical protein
VMESLGLISFTQPVHNRYRHVMKKMNLDFISEYF